MEAKTEAELEATCAQVQSAGPSAEHEPGAPLVGGVHGRSGDPDRGGRRRGARRIPGAGRTAGGPGGRIDRCGCGFGIRDRRRRDRGPVGRGGRIGRRKGASDPRVEWGFPETQPGPPPLPWATARWMTVHIGLVQAGQTDG